MASGLVAGHFLVISNEDISDNFCAFAGVYAINEISEPLMVPGHGSMMVDITACRLNSAQFPAFDSGINSVFACFIFINDINISLYDEINLILEFFNA